MPGDVVRSAKEALRSTDKSRVERAVRDLSAELQFLEDLDYRAVVEALCSLFYIDTYDRPDLEPALDQVEEVLAGQGVKIVPLLLEFMAGSDIKSHLHLAQALGRIGSPAVSSLRRFIATAEDPYSRSFALFAVGKIHAPEIQEALPEVVGSLMHPDKEVRDSAARVLGKIAEVVPPERITERRRNEMFEALFRALDDRMPAVRAKAVRSLGKLAGASYLTANQAEQLKTTLRRLAGEDEHYDWERAFIVRREAEEAYEVLTGKK